MSDEMGEGGERRSWFRRLKDGLAKSSSKLVGDISGVFTAKRLDDASLEELEDILITADLGIETSARLISTLSKAKFGKNVTDEEVRSSFAEEIAEILRPAATPLDIATGRKPHIILMVGVNGSGKTTTIGKLASQFKARGLSVMMAAGDTFRAAAIEQLQIWGERTNTPVIAKTQGSDSAALAFDAISEAKAAGADILLIDTAGRLQNRAELMEELAKVIRVIRKQDETAPHDCVLVLDGTVGQNAHSQVKAFKEMVEVSGLVITKLDGSTRGGVVVALADQFKLPVHAVGVGERVEDLQPFNADRFARDLMGLT
jgi:fused signal recognition particle receptor